jgi:uncharacterized protein YfeS
MAPSNLSVEQARTIVQATTFDIFNEHDALKRRTLMEKYWSENATCYSPFGVAEGYDALDQVWGGELLPFNSPLLLSFPKHIDST